MRAPDIFLLVGFGLVAAAGYLVTLPLGLATTGIECVALAYLLERRALSGEEVVE